MFGSPTGLTTALLMYRIVKLLNHVKDIYIGAV